MIVYMDGTMCLAFLSAACALLKNIACSCIIFLSAHTHYHMVFPCTCFAGLLMISALHMAPCCLAPLPAGRCWWAIWAPSLPRSLCALPSGGCQHGPNPVVTLLSGWLLLILVYWYRFSFVFFRLLGIPLAEFRHHLEEQLMCLIAFSKMIMAHRLQLGNSFIFPFDCRDGRMPLCT